MIRLLVPDAGPLISLARINRLELIDRFNFRRLSLIPPSPRPMILVMMIRIALATTTTTTPIRRVLRS
ncbi:hypothetical protein OCH239_10810 [Roseivivax halodurans JCM 10272]|uniref:Uncharacterized protein n=1 Tax=Roseivivax halodurans JCM 10272 TaxID=1449350 RepID=X7EBU0_9RHOB|nr:hypothetical protein OCH239_10810 [Roseivivax halodurans JCM 10272]